MTPRPPAAVMRAQLEAITGRRPLTAAREDLRALVAGAAAEDLPGLVGELARAQAEALARIAAPSRNVEGRVPLVALTPEWAEANGYKFETAQKLARTGRLKGASPAPSSGKGCRRRWLVPATLRAHEDR